MELPTPLLLPQRYPSRSNESAPGIVSAIIFDRRRGEVSSDWTFAGRTVRHKRCNDEEGATATTNDRRRVPRRYHRPTKRSMEVPPIVLSRLEIDAAFRSRTKVENQMQPPSEMTSLMHRDETTTLSSFPNQKEISILTLWFRGRQRRYPFSCCALKEGGDGHSVWIIPPPRRRRGKVYSSGKEREYAAVYFIAAEFPARTCCRRV